MELKDLLGTRTIEVPWGDDIITVTYNLGTRTPGTTDQINMTGSIVDVIVLLVESWDITADGRPVPVDKDELAKVPVPVLRKIASFVLGDDGLGEVSRSSDAG